MRILTVLAAAALAAAPALAQKPGDRTSTPGQVLGDLGAADPMAEAERIAAAAAAHPLGSLENPVRVGGPQGARAYIARLRCADGSSPQIVGYRASNEVSVRFRDIANSGKILDALVAQGANQINGPMLAIDKPEAALDEARTQALANARARAELYAKALGKKVGRILAISEAGANYAPPVIMMRQANRGAVADSTSIDPGEQSVAVSLSVTFELE